MYAWVKKSKWEKKQTGVTKSSGRGITTLHATSLFAKLVHLEPLCDGYLLVIIYLIICLSVSNNDDGV